MTCSANKKKATPSVGHDSCVAHMRLFKFILGISWTYLGQNAGSEKLLCLSLPETLSVYRRAIQLLSFT